MSAAVYQTKTTRKTPQKQGIVRSGAHYPVGIFWLPLNYAETAALRFRAFSRRASPGKDV